MTFCYESFYSAVFQCCIDLKHNVLRIGTTGNEAMFLSEADLKDKEQLERQQAVSKIITYSLLLKAIISSSLRCTGSGNGG